MYVSWVFADKLRMVMSSIMRWRSGEIGLVIGETPVSGLHKTCNPCRQATAYRCNHFDGVGRQAMTITATSDNQIRKSKIRNWTIGLQTFATGSLPRSGLVQQTIMEDLPGLPDQSALTPANFTTLADFSVSSTRSLPKSAGEPGRAVAPNSANRAFILGSARAALISLLSLSTISAGVLFGAPTPVQKLDSYPGTNSATVGISGNTGERVAVVTASARSLPPLTYSIDEDMVANMTCTCPPSRSTSAGPAPRYGTCTRLTPVIILNSSPAIWFPEPMPADAMLMLAGLALA